MLKMLSRWFPCTSPWQHESSGNEEGSCFTLHLTTLSLHNMAATRTKLSQAELQAIHSTFTESVGNYVTESMLGP